MKIIINNFKKKIRWIISQFPKKKWYNVINEKFLKTCQNWKMADYREVN